MSRATEPSYWSVSPEQEGLEQDATDGSGGIDRVMPVYGSRMSLDDVDA